MKAPLPDRIRALEDSNMQLIEKINRMKAQVRHNQGLIRKYQQRMAEPPRPPAARAPRTAAAQQAERDRQRTKERQQAEYRRQMERRLHECRVMNGLEPE